MNRRLKLGLVLGTGTAGLGYAAYKSLTPEKVLAGAAEAIGHRTYTNLGDLSERERALHGKIVRPVFPTSGEELSDYMTIIGSLKSAKVQMILGGCVGSIGGGALGFLSTRGIESSAKRILTRLILVPTLVSVFSFGGAMFTLTYAVYRIRDRAHKVMTPVSSGTDLALRNALPSAAVDKLTFKCIPGLEK